MKTSPSRTGPRFRRAAAVDDVKETLWAIRGEGSTVECARCGKRITIEQAIPEEGGEWECEPCNTRCNEQERKEALRREGAGS